MTMMMMMPFIFLIFILKKSATPLSLIKLYFDETEIKEITSENGLSH